MTTGQTTHLHSVRWLVLVRRSIVISLASIMSFDYVKERVLGRGAFGVVYLVHQETAIGMAGPFVLKEIGIRDAKQRHAAHQESRLLSQLNHPNIIRYLDSFESPGTGHLCLVMEYCPGGDVGALIRKRRGVPFDEPLIITWYRQLASALDYLHQRKILHRDIKTGNIFVSADSSVLKLGDFGVAKVLDQTSQMAQTCVGTPSYLSPEICGRGRYNNKSDVWSLGCVYYQIMTLHPPFTGRNMNQLLGAILRGHFQPMPARYSYELRQMVAAMLRKNPDERPSAEALLKKRLLMDTGRPSSGKSVISKRRSTRLKLKAPAAKKEKSKKEQTRRKWTPPTQSLIGALSSLCLTDTATFTLSGPSRCFESDYTINHSDASSSAISDSYNEDTCVIRRTESPFHRLERWGASLEAVHGVQFLKEGKSTSTHFTQF